MEPTDPRYKRLMDPKVRQELAGRLQVVQVFFGEIRLQCIFVLIANVQLQRARDDTEIWYAVQNLLVAAANISTLAWGGGKKIRAEARRNFRGFLGLRDTSPVYDQTVRDHFIHFDSRFDVWAGEVMPGKAKRGATKVQPSELRNFIGRVIASTRDNFTLFSGAGVNAAEVFYQYDPQTGEVRFQRDSVSIPALVEEAQKVLAAADAWNQKMPWDQLAEL